MTNIMAFRVSESGGPVYVVSDSQGTDRNYKSPVQKLFALGSNVFTAAGPGEGISYVMDAVRKLGGDLQPAEIADTMLQAGKGINLGRKQKDRLAFILAGLEDQAPVLYHVVVLGDRGIVPVRKVPSVFEGAGTSQSTPAFNRDAETGNLNIPDIYEGMRLCFSYGTKGCNDVHADDKLQIAMVDMAGPHLLYCPFTPLDGEQHSWTNYYKWAIGLDVPDRTKIPDDLSLGFVDVYAALNDLYQAILTECRNMSASDYYINWFNTWSKTDADSRDVHKARRREELVLRDVYKSSVKDLVDAWVSRDINRIGAALKSYHERREKQHGKAIKTVETVSKGLYPIQPKLPFGHEDPAS